MESKRLQDLSLEEAEEALETTWKLRDEKAAVHEFDDAEHCGHVMTALAERIEELRRG